MDIEPQSTTSGQSTELKAQLDSLRHVVISAVILVIIVSGTLNVFLLRQVKYARADLNAIRPQVTQIVAEYNKTTAPVVNDFARKLVEFGQKNPDFMPIVVKYGLTKAVTNGTPAVSPAVTPALPPGGGVSPAPKK